MTDTQMDTDLAPSDGQPSMPTDVRADRVEISQGGANSVTAKTVTITQGGAGRVSAEEMSVSQGGVGAARVTRLNINSGGSAFGVLADEANLGDGAMALVVIARSSSGGGRVMIDWRAAAAFGAAFGAVMALLRRGR